MAYIEAHQSLRDHRKILALAAELDMPEPHVAGHCLFLWLWAIDNAPEGELPASTRIIERAAAWEGSPGRFVAAMAQVGMLDRDGEDGPLCIHDWWVYAGRLIEKRRANAERMRLARASQDSGDTTERAAHVQRTSDARAGATVAEAERSVADRSGAGSPPDVDFSTPQQPSRAHASAPTPTHARDPVPTQPRVPVPAAAAAAAAAMDETELVSLVERVARIARWTAGSYDAESLAACLRCHAPALGPDRVVAATATAREWYGTKKRRLDLRLLDSWLKTEAQRAAEAATAAAQREQNREGQHDGNGHNGNGNGNGTGGGVQQPRRLTEDERAAAEKADAERLERIWQQRRPFLAQLGQGA